MSNKTCKIIGIVAAVLIVAASVYGYFNMPEMVTVSIFGEDPVPAWIVLLGGMMMIGLCVFRLIQSPNEKVSMQILVFEAVLIILVAIFVFSFV